jgi:hypothetical protein
MSWGIRQPTLTGPKADPALLARAQADLANNPQFAAWMHKNANQTIDVHISPSNFGINYLPGDVWIDKHGAFHSPDTSFPWGPLAATVGAGAAAGFGGAALAGGPAATHAAPDLATAPALGSTAPGVMAGTTLPAELGSMTAAQMAAAFGSGAAHGGGDAAAGAMSLADFLKDPKTYASIAGLLTTLASKPGSGSGSGDVFSQNPQLQHLLDVSSQRVDRTDPLHQAVTQLAMQRLPTNVQR